MDSLITIPNAKLLTALGKTVSLLDAFKEANNVLLGAVQGISELITRPGLINVDFADVRTVMSEMGMSMMGTGTSSGDERAENAARAAISSPLLEDIQLNGARGILVNITAGMDMGIHEFDEVGSIVREFASDEATVVVGTVIDPDMSDEIRVTLVATGLDNEEEVVQQQKPQTVVRKSVATKSKLKPVTLEPRDKSSVKPEYAKTNRYDKKGGYDISTLDIPAFLRKQAD